jgi:hypothetical protein
MIFGRFSDDSRAISALFTNDDWAIEQKEPALLRFEIRQSSMRGIGSIQLSNNMPARNGAWRARIAPPYLLATYPLCARKAVTWRGRCHAKRRPGRHKKFFNFPPTLRGRAHSCASNPAPLALGGACGELLVIPDLVRKKKTFRFSTEGFL